MMTRVPPVPPKPPSGGRYAQLLYAPTASSIVVVIEGEGGRRMMFVRHVDGSAYTEVQLPESDLGFSHAVTDGSRVYAAALRYIAPWVANWAGLLCVDVRTSSASLLYPVLAGGAYELVDVLGISDDGRSLLCKVAAYTRPESNRVLVEYSVGSLVVQSGELEDLHPLATPFG